MRLVTSIVSESLKAAGARRSELLSTSPTSALLREGRLPEPAKMTSSMPEARMFLNEFSPITQRRASTRFDLPQPFGPTTPVNPGSILNSALSQKLLKPVRRKRSNFIVATLRSGSAHALRCSPHCPQRIIFREARTGLSGHIEVAQSTRSDHKPVRNRGRRRARARKRATGDAPQFHEMMALTSARLRVLFRIRAAPQLKTARRSASLGAPPRRHGRSQSK